MQSDADLQAELLNINQPPVSRSFNLLLNILFVGIVMAIFAVLYYFNMITKLDMTRIGIAIGIISGLLTYPSLIKDTILKYTTRLYIAISRAVARRNAKLVIFSDVKKYGITYYAFIIYGPFITLYLLVRSYFWFDRNSTMIVVVFLVMIVLAHLLSRLTFNSLLKRTDLLVRKYGTEARYRYDLRASLLLMASLMYISLTSFSALHITLPLIKGFNAVARNMRSKTILATIAALCFFSGELLQFIGTF